MTGDRRRPERVRRAVDVLAVLAVAPVVVPLVLVLALVIKLDSPGPAVWGHPRFGRGGRRFELLKLRTMCRDADEQKRRLMHLNVLEWPDFKIPDDPRVTRVGRWLRRTSLDELPQLWNVLAGEMTLVGPRACSVPLSDYALWQTERLEVTPGLFGLWQASGRNTADFAARCRMDIGQIRSPGLLSSARHVVLSLRSVLAMRRDF